MLVGMGGVGKTSLARAFAQRHLADYGIVWWVRAEDPSAIDAEFRALLEILLPPGEAAHITNARTTAFALLAKQEHPWLLVLDNVPNAGSAQGLLPPAGNGHVLITSRATAWPNPTTVQPLDTNAAIELLTTQSGDLGRVAAEALATELGGLPLALTQAAGFVRANAIDLATYLRLYRDRSAELHEEGRPADYPYTVATTWQLAIDRLTESAREMLNVVAFYAPDAIPAHMLFRGMDELARLRAIGELGAYSLVTPEGSNAITVHRLVQAVTRDRLGPQAYEWADKARALMMAALPKHPVTVTATSLATWNALQTHVHALVDHLPPENPDTLATRYNLAYWTGEAGHAVQARDLFAELVAIRERLLDVEHPDTLVARHYLAFWTGSAGDAALARDLFAELLTAHERVFGVEHPITLGTRQALASWMGHSGDVPRARDLLAELVPAYERVVGAEQPVTLAARELLAFWTAQAGDAVAGRDLFAELVPMYERASGAGPLDALSARHNLAYWTGVAGDAVRARDMFAELLPIYENEFGIEHPRTLVARHNLARWIGDAGDAVRAWKMFAELLSIRERVLDAEHPHTSATRAALTYWAELAGEVEEEGPGGGGEG